MKNDSDRAAPYKVFKGRKSLNEGADDLDNGHSLIDERQKIQSFLSLIFNQEECTLHPLATNLLQKTYLVTLSEKKLILKIINLQEAAKIFQKEKKQIIHHYSTYTSIYQDLSKTFPMPNIVLAETQPFVIFEDYFLLFYTYSPKEERDIATIPLSHKLKIAEILATLHQIDYHIYPSDYWEAKFLNYQSMYVPLIEMKAHYPLIEMMNNLLGSSKLQDFILKICNFQHFIDMANDKETLVFSHNDIKPKNILWDQEGNYEIIDWDEMYPTSRGLDLIDTLTSWFINKNAFPYTLQHHDITIFLSKYKEITKVPLHISSRDLYISALKWLGWLFTCQLYHNEEGVKDACFMIELLFNEQSYLTGLS